MRFAIEKHNLKTGQKIDYGSGYSRNDIDQITKGYKYKLVPVEREIRWYERKNSNWIFIATAIEE